VGLGIGVAWERLAGWAAFHQGTDKYDRGLGLNVKADRLRHHRWRVDGNDLLMRALTLRASALSDCRTVGGEAAEAEKRRHVRALEEFEVPAWTE
jgi:hypothetical protein